MPAASLREQRAEKFKDPGIKLEIELWARRVRGAITGGPRPSQDAPGPSRGSPNLEEHCEDLTTLHTISSAKHKDSYNIIYCDSLD